MFVMVLTVIRLCVLAADMFPLYGDEAQYWVWAKAPDWGYYSKPPLIAWIIAASTAAFGDNPMGVRLSSPILHAGTALILLQLGRRLYGDRVGAWAAVVYASLPAVSLSSIIMSTDVPLLFCWALALLCLVEALATDRWRWWLGLGVAFGFGLLAKYAMAVFAASLVLYLGGSAKHRLQAANPRLWAGFGLGLLIYLPNLIWNSQNSFASYRHTGDNANLQPGNLFHPAELLEFLGGQLAVFGPALFAILLALLLLRLPSLRRDDRTWMMAAFALPQLAMICGVALLSRANANWAAAAYVSASLLVVAWAAEGSAWRRRLVIGSVALHLAAGLGLYLFHPVAHAAGIKLTRTTDPFRRLMGWDRVGRAVAQVMQQHPGAVLMTDDRMLFASLAFYIRPRPVQVQWNPDGRIQNHFELTTDIRQFADSEILYVTSQENPGAVAFFRQAQPVSGITVPLYPDYARRYVVWKLAGLRQ